MSHKSAPCCQVCGREMLRTSVRYYVCPEHGGLRPAKDIDKKEAAREDNLWRRRLDSVLKPKEQ